MSISDDGIDIYESGKGDWFVVCRYMIFNRNILTTPKITLFYNRERDRIANIKIYLYDDIAEMAKYKVLFDEIGDIGEYSLKFQDDFKYIAKMIVDDRNSKLQKPPADFKPKSVSSIPRTVYKLLGYINSTFDNPEYINMKSGEMVLAGINANAAIKFNIYTSVPPIEILEKMKTIRLEFANEKKNASKPWYQECTIQ